MSRRDPRDQARFLTALCAGMGVLHFVVPRLFDPLVPEQLPGGPRAWTHGSGLAELVVAGLLAVPATRRAGGAAAAGLFVGVYPGNLKMAWDWRTRPWLQRVVALARLPLQADLVSRARLVARG